MARHAPENVSPLVRTMLALEGASGLDGLTRSADNLAAALAPDGPVRDLLTGRSLGHALHPAVTDLPLGLWTAGSVFDLVGLLGGDDARPAARRLVGLGVLAAPAAVWTGWAEWRGTDLPRRRVGVVHAGLNASAVTAYAVSWALRPRHHRAGVVAALVGGALAGASGFLGGHLAAARHVASHDAAFARGRSILAADRQDLSDARPDPATGARAPDDQQTSASAPATATIADLAAAVAGEHGRCRTAFERLHLAAAPVADDLLQLTRTVAQHAVLHSEILRAYADTVEAREAVDARVTEDEGMAQQIRQLEGMALGTPTFSLQLGLFGDALEHHLAAQLSQETPVLAERMSPEQRGSVVSVLAGGPKTGDGAPFAEMVASARTDVQRWLPT